jgi:ubiquinone/menaquinone biosynthesis C-methylase UbiE
MVDAKKHLEATMQKWDQMTHWYRQFEQFSVQSTITCCAMTNSSQADAILEVGAGPGLHCEFIAKSYLKPGAILVSCDLSTEMIKCMESRFATSDFLQYKDASVHFDAETDYPADSTLKWNGDRPQGRHVFGCRADNQRLPFPDQYFSAYVSNLSMMIVGDYRQQISEAFRVLKPGSRACFSVWGRQENCLQFQITSMACERLGRPAPEGPPRTNFHLNEKKEEVCAEFLKAGFKDLKMWYQPSNWLYRNGEEFVKAFLAPRPDTKEEDSDLK